MPEGDGNPEISSVGASPDGADRSLAQRVRAGDRWAFEQLARRYLRSIHAVVASYLREPADVEDAAQETFLRALERIHTYDPARPFAPWLYQIARNVARNHRNWLGRHASDAVEPAELPAREPDPQTGMERSEIRRMVGAAIERLPEQRRTAFRLFDVEGYPAEEIAGLMGVSVGTVRSHVHHARRALRSELTPLRLEMEDR